MNVARPNKRTLFRSGVSFGGLTLAFGMSVAPAQAQTYQPSVEVDLSVLDTLGPAPALPSVDLYGAGVPQADLSGATPPPDAALSEGSVLLLPVPDTAANGTGTVLLLNEPATTASNDFEFPTAPEPEPAETTVVTTIEEPEPEPKPEVMPEPEVTVEAEVMAEPEMEPVDEVVEETLIVVSTPGLDSPPSETGVAAASGVTSDDVFSEIDTMLNETAEPQDVTVPEPEMTMDGADVAAISTDDAALSSEGIRILFQPEDDALTAEDETALRNLATRLDAEPNRRIQLRAYASSEGTSASDARRLALSRALAVRAFLIENNVRSTRIDVRALGDKAESGPLDRIDIVLVER